MKHINESIIGKRSNQPIGFPKRATGLENVKSFYSGSGKGTADFYIDIPNIKHKGLDDVTDFIWSMVFENRKTVANPTQWLIHDLGLNDYIDDYRYSTRFLLPGIGTRDNSGFIMNMSPLFDNVDELIRNSIYKIVCEFDGSLGLDNINLRIQYKYDRHSRQLTGVTIFLN